MTRRAGCQSLSSPLLFSLLLLLCTSFPPPTKAENNNNNNNNSNNIKHVIALMMENRSFDHLLGFLHLLNPEIEGLSGDESQPYHAFVPEAGEVKVNNQGFDTGPDDPCHDFGCISEQIYGKTQVEGHEVEGHARMNGFVQNALRVGHTALNPMSMFDNNSAPILNTLAMEYAVFDHWYCSLPGPTDPNRQFVMSGTSDSVISNFNGTLWAQQSYFDLLTEKDVSWRAYYQGDPWAIMYFQDTHNPDNAKNIFKIDQFYEDLKGKESDFPSFVFLQPSMNVHGGQRPTWQHPDASVSEGEQFIKDLYEAIRASDIWDSCLFVITYDEHGGFYDHVPPPQTGVPPPDNRKAPNGFGFDRLGVRVPTVAISPFIKKGTVVHTPTLPTPSSQFESTSIMATTNLIFNISDGFLSSRVEWAGTFVDVLTDKRREDAPEILPKVKREGGKEEEDRRVEEQLGRELNDHQEAQVMFYCVQNYGVKRGERVKGGEGERCGEGLETQREGNAWLEREIRVFEERVIESAKKYNFV